MTHFTDSVQISWLDLAAFERQKEMAELFVSNSEASQADEYNNLK